jgi:hypothetical protein
MGWASGTAVFDNIMAEVLSRKPLTKERVIRAVIVALEGADADDLESSDYFDHELVQAELKKLHPEDFEEEEP